MKYIKDFKLFELHYIDMFPKKFEEFRKKYNKISRTPEGRLLYVQFTNFKGDVLDRTSSETTDHADPMGNYAYPLSYVINNPADLWYGMDANNLRILEKTDLSTTLILSNIYSEEDCIYKALKLNKEWKNWTIQDYIKIVKTNYKKRIEPKNSGYWGRVFFQILQVDLTVEPNPDALSPFPIRSAKEQTNMLLRAGWNVIEDNSTKDTTAIINDREPQQICFLDRKTFKVIDIFNLNYNKKKSVSTSFKPDELIEKKLATNIFNILDDKIKEVYTRYTPHIYYSVKGRQLIIQFIRPNSYYDKKLGQKIHKANKLVDEHSPSINLNTEKGIISYSGTHDEKLSDTINYIKNRWEDIKNTKDIEGWIPRNKKKKEEKDNKDKKEYYEKQKEKKNIDNIKQIPSFKKRLEEWKKYLKYNYNIHNDNESLLNLVIIFEKISNIATHRNTNDALDFITKEIDVISDNKHLVDDNYSSLLLELDDTIEKNEIVDYLKFLKTITEFILTKEEKFYYQNFYKMDLTI